MEHRVKNVIYSEPPMPRWKRFLVWAGSTVGLLFLSIAHVILSHTYGDLYVFSGVMLFFAVAMALAIWWERRKRSRRRASKQHIG